MPSPESPTSLPAAGDPNPSRKGAAATVAGQSASPGIAYGPACLGPDSLESAAVGSIPESAVEEELARLDSVARAARVSLVRQREALAPHFTEEQLRIFDAHLRMLEDPVIEADVRERIRVQHMNLEAAVKDALSVYERLYEVVESEALRNRMSDMRDVALRLLRFCQRRRQEGGGKRMQGGVLVVQELSLSDLTEAMEHGVAAIVAEGGALGTHGAILTRAAGIPAVIGVEGLRELLQEGDMLLVDGDSGQVAVNPPAEAVNAALGREVAETPAALPPAELADGTPVTLRAAAASPREVRIAARMGVKEVGLYRTDLPVIQRQGALRETSLASLYRQAVSAAEEVTFRLPDLDGTCEIERLYPQPETNPALGLRGCRLLLTREDLLLVQLRAILRAAAGRTVRIAAPFLNDPGDLVRIRETLDTVREVLRLDGVDVSQPADLGVVLETPAAALLAREILREADFALLGLDTLAQLLLAADAAHTHEEVARRLRSPHPATLRAVRKLLQIADGLGRELILYGESLRRGPMLPLVVGLGARDFAVPPESLQEVHARLAALDPEECEEVAEDACRAATPEEVLAEMPGSWRPNPDH